MSETHTPTGNVGSTLTRFTSGEAATGTFGTMDRNNITAIGDKIRFITDAGLYTPTVTGATDIAATLAASNASYTGSVITIAASRAGSSAFNLINCTANSVATFVVNGGGAITTVASAVFTNGISLGAATLPSNGIAFGSSAPGVLANGQLWFDGTDFKVRHGGATKTVTVA